MGEGEVTVNCPCGYSFQTSAEEAEKLVNCPACRNTFKPENPVPQEEAPTVSLGQILLEKGWVKPEQIQEALRKQAEALASGKTIRLGEALVEIGALTPQQAKEALGAQDTTPMRCPSCGKVYNVRGPKAGKEATCRKCRVALVTASGTVVLKPDDTTVAPARRPAGEAFDPKLETLIPGYRLLRRLGYGGMGAVFLARQESLNRLVAVKLLPPEFGNDPQHVRRFLQEARSAAKVSHENIVGAVDAGEAGGRYFFIMEYIPGETLFKFIRKKKKLPESRALDIARQVARGLRHAYKNGLVHRDIKPKNLILTPEGTVKICDFGLARSISGEDAPSKAGVVLASPAYASPEQCRGSAQVDHRSDMYSLGVTLYEMLTGKRPFEAESAAEMLSLQVSKEPPPPRSLNPAVSAGAEKLVLKLLSKKPEDRFGDYDELLAAIDALMPAAAGAPPRRPEAPPARPRIPAPWLATAGLGAAAALLLVMVVVATGRRKLPPPTGPEEAPAAPPQEPAPAPSDPKTEALFNDAREFQERASGNPSQYEAVRSRWKELVARFRGRPEYARFAAALMEFEEKIGREAETAGRQAIDEAETHIRAGRLLEAYRILRGFPAGLAHTDGGRRVAARKLEVQKLLDDRVRNETDTAAADLSGHRFEEAHARLQDLYLWLQEAERAGYENPGQLRNVENLIRRVDKEQRLATGPRPSPAPGPVPPTPDPGPKPPDPAPGPVPSPPPPSGPAAPAAVLRSAALRADPARRAAAAAAFAAEAAKSPLHRAAALFLSREESAWGLEERTSRALDEHLAHIPPGPESLTPAQHLKLLELLARKIAECGEARTDALELFACAHLSGATAKGIAPPPPELLKQARLAKGPSTSLWGNARAVARIEMARILQQPPGLGSALAAESASSAPDFGDRLLAGLGTFKAPTLDLARAAERWKKLAGTAPEPVWADLCESVAEQLRQSAVCDSCQGKGSHPCGTCGGTGGIPCTGCRGTGRVPDGYGGRMTCPTCKQRGTVPCAGCGGSKIVKCGACEGKKTRPTAPGGLFRYLLELGLCSACSGTGSVFPTAAWPCPACEGLGRSPERFRQDYQKLPAWMVKVREGRSIWNALRWLARHQSPEGSWPTSLNPAACPEKGCDPVLILVPRDTGVTALAVLAFLGAGLNPRSELELGGARAGPVLHRALAWIAARQQADGLIALPAATQPLLDHLLATAALSAAAASLPAAAPERAPIQEAARRAVKYALAAQQKNSGWGYAAAQPADSWITSWGLLALLAARDAGMEIPKPAFSGLLQWFDSMTDKNDLHVAYNTLTGGKVSYLVNATFHHHETLSASAALARLLLEGRASGPVLAAERLLQRDPPGAEAPRRDFCYAFWGTQFLAHRHQRRGNDWAFWVLAVERMLLSLQETGETCALGSWAPSDRWGMFGGKACATALNALTLETASGIRPLAGAK